ncbi:MAG: DUF3795 domain-containing protein [candidate division Zixibacteria bacterium]|nr:DUF3795 domain-containing protein [candidate division Zixibacteria bacterium]
MERMIAFCGLVCSKCPAFIATKKNDDDERRKVAEMWSKEFKVDLKPEEINCDGCVVDSENLFSHTKVCEIRKCGKEKKVENCAYCDEYACEKLTNFFKMATEAKTNLDEVRKNL